MRTFILSVAFTLMLEAGAQLPVEVFVGHQRASFDMMFFKYFKSLSDQTPTVPSRWLFFNRNRAIVDYRMTSSTYLPQFGLTEAISYNHPSLKGVAPVGVAQVLNSGFYTKAGVQYVRLHNQLTLFTWLVSETRTQPDLDCFLLLRYTPKLTPKLQLFSQVESINVLPTSTSKVFVFTQRLRLGIQRKSYQCGAGADFTQSGRTSFTQLFNIGGFIRHEF